MIVAVIGNVETGIKLVGPYEDEAAADKHLTVEARRAIVKFLRWRPVALISPQEYDRLQSEEFDVACDSCNWKGKSGLCDPVTDIGQRLDDPCIHIPSGQCPICGALAYSEPYPKT